MKRTALAALVAVVTTALTLSFATAQQTRARPKKAPHVAADAAAPRAPETVAGAGDGGATEVSTAALDGGVKVFRFGEMEIEGRLRSPQLVYFLRRVRAEFAAEDLGHRTFMRELSDTRKDPNL